jgi:hypothetical protein
MPYPQTDWKDHVTEYENRYTESTNPDGSITHTKVEGEVIQQGTPMSATNFNHQEDGIGEAAALADALFTQVLLLLGHGKYSLEELDAAKLDVNGKAADAAKADKLGTPRTIAISGGATAAGVSFDGSGNITIIVTELDPSKLSAAVAVAKGGTGATDAAGARTNLDVPSNTDTISAMILGDAQRSVDQAVQRDLDERLITAEAQIAAMGT